MQWLLFIVFSLQIQVPMGDEETICQDYVNNAERKAYTISSKLQDRVKCL